MVDLLKHSNHPLISVIIPCYNHGAYLSEALASIRQQEYPTIEVVVVDDGSTDMTQDVVKSHPWVKYIYQVNQGLSAARNKGVMHSCGQYIVFLDADDWLLPNALTINAQYLRANPNLALVSGGHNKVFIVNGLVEKCIRKVSTNHYEHLLRGNYIGMPASVMFQRWVFDSFVHDTTLRASEDYDLYLRIARLHPVGHHNQLIAAYRLHASNMSSNVPLMLRTTLAVLARQHKHLQTNSEFQAYAQGCKNWKNYYCNLLYQKLKPENGKATLAEIGTLLLFDSKSFISFCLRNQIRFLRKLFEYCGF
jgi:glycosyltransferase involved in cell wall biosynthesis